MVRLSHFYPFLLFLLFLSCEGRNLETNRMPAKYMGWLGPSGEYYNGYMADSGRGTRFSLLTFTSIPETRSTGGGCMGDKAENWDEARTTLDGSLPGLSLGTATQNERRSFTLTSQNLQDRGTYISAGNGDPLWIWYLNGSAPLNANHAFLNGQYDRIDTLPPWAGQPAEPILIVKGPFGLQPLDPNAGSATWKPIALLREVRFSRTHGVVYFHYQYFDRQGAMHEEKVLRVN